MSYEFFIGVDVGKYFHHACVLNADGEIVESVQVQQTNHDLTEFLSRYTNNGPTLVTVDQPNNIGRLTVEIARYLGADVKYLPGLAMRQLARIHAGNSKTDVRDAYVIAHASRTLSEALRATNRDNPVFQQLKALNGIDDDITRAYTRCINQIRASLIGVYPEFEQALRGDILHRNWVLQLLAKYGGPTGLKNLGKARAVKFAKARNARKPEPIIDALFDAINAQIVEIPSAIQVEKGVRIYAKDALNKLEDREEIAHDVNDILDSIPEAEILMSMPGVGRKTAAAILMAVGDLSDFDTAEQLASYAGICPTTHQSGTSIHSQRVNRAGNKKLKNALWQSSFSAIRTHERSRQYYERKRQEGKRHNAALICLSRRRLNVMFAMIKNKTLYDDTIAGRIADNTA